MLWIGITGPMGSGKSTVARLLKEMGFPVLDADKIAQKVLDPGTPGEAEAFRIFGQSICGNDGKLDRRALGRLVFNDSAKLHQLESIIHPLVRAEVARLRAELAAQGNSAAFYDVPLLFEKNMRPLFDHVLVTSASKKLRSERVKVRSSWSEAEIEERNARHLPAEVKEAAASAVIRNEGSLEDLRREIEMVLLKVGVKLPTST